MKRESIFKSIGAKILIIFLSMGILSSGVIGLMSVTQSRKAVRNEAINKLSCVAELKTKTIEDFLNNRYGEIHVITGLELFRNACALIIKDIRTYNIKPSVNIKETRQRLERVSESYRYVKQYLKKYKDSLQNYNEIKVVAAYDIKNTDGETVFRKGDQVCSVNDFAGNTANRSMFAGAYELMENKDKGIESEKYNCTFLYTSSIEHCGELNHPSIHMSHGIAFPGLSADMQRRDTPIEERFSLILISDIKIETINKLMEEKTGMGDTGESYIVGTVNGKAGYYMLTQSRLTNEDTILKREVNTKDIQRVFREQQKQRGGEFCENNIYSDYQGNKDIGHNHYMKIGKHEWGIITEVEASEIFKDANNLMFFIITAALIVVILIVIVSIFFSRSISKPLSKVTDVLKNASGQIASASAQLSSSSQEIASGATEQASSIEETSSSMEELASMVKQNVSNAQEASILAQKSSEASQNGHNQMESMLESMTQINKASEEIQKIIKVIDDIAFQTNILALNAAVEAARAGEAGMGFAVVADEVKSLANKSAEAAKETSNIIEDSIKKTGDGLDTATKLAEVFKEILNNAQKVAEMVKEVETAGKQQDTGINQVNKAIVQLDEVVQANASSAEETASSAEELLTQVETLSDIVKQLVLIVSGKEESIEEHKELKHIEYKNAMTKKINTKKREDIKQFKTKEIPPEKIIPFEEDEDFAVIE